MSVVALMMEYAILLLLVALGFGAGFSIGYSLRAMRRGEHPNGLKHYRRPRESWLLPDSRVVWLLQLVGAVVGAMVLGWGLAALIVMWWR